MRLERAELGGFTAKQYGVSRLERSDKGWPIVDISQLEIIMLSISAELSDFRKRLTQVCQLLLARSCGIRGCRSYNRRGSTFRDLLVAFLDLGGMLPLPRSMGFDQQVPSSLRPPLELARRR